MHKWIPVAIVVALSLAVAAPASAKKCGGVELNDKITVEGDELVLNGMGLREATIFSVNVYAAGLYLEERSSNGKAIASSDQKKRLVMEFVRDVDRKDIVDAYRESFNKTAKGKNLDDKISKLLGWMSSVNKGDSQMYTYIPGKGLTVELNLNKKGTIPGSDFAEAFFKIWLGDSPPNEGLKSGLLGGSCG